VVARIMRSARLSTSQLLPHHVSPYDRLSWSDVEVEQLLVGGEHRRELESYFGVREVRELSALAQAARGVAPRANAPRVLIVPGIMGSQLGLMRRAPLPHDVVWIDPVDITAGRLAMLKPARDDGIVSLGVVLYTYLRLKLYLKAAGFDAVFFDYDWRLGVDVLGNALAERLRQESAARIMLVAHSMGGLVSRAALAAERHERVERVVLLGTPNFGSFAAVQALRGTYATVRKLARLHRQRSAEWLASHVFNDFPSLYHLLPAPGHGARLDLFDGTAWPRSGPRPRKELLAHARKFIVGLPRADERFVVIAGVNQETVTAVSRSADGFVYTVTRNGDGTVPTAQALLPGALTYFTGAAHSELTRDPIVAQAVADLLRSGRTSQLPTRRARLNLAEARISDAQLQRTQTEKVDWSALTPTARRDFLQTLNEPPELTLRLPARPRARRVPRSAPRRPR
jgi:pimeloyl-ACP methyl ester carboxylesterase